MQPDAEGPGPSAVRRLTAGLALAGHNAGWGRVDEYRGMPDENFAQGQTYHYVRVCALGGAGSGLHSSVAQLSAECGPEAVNHLPGYAGSTRLTELRVRTSPPP